MSMLVALLYLVLALRAEFATPCGIPQGAPKAGVAGPERALRCVLELPAWPLAERKAIRIAQGAPGVSRSSPAGS